MTQDGRYFTWTMVAGENLDGTGHLFKAIAGANGKLAENGREAGGILVFGGRTGEHVSLGYSGIMKFVAGECIRGGALLTVGKRGYFFRACKGDYIVGRCLESTVNTGSVGTGAFNFATPAYCNGDGLNRTTHQPMVEG